MTGFRALALVLAPLVAVSGTIIQLDDSPTFISSNGLPVQWHSGAAAQWALSSLLVRVNPRGLFFKRLEWHLRDLSSLSWGGISCAPSAHGLCQTDTSVFFPSSQPPEVNEGLASLCGATDTHRVVTSAARYDTSACDVLSAKMDYVYAREVMYSRSTQLPQWMYWTVCVAVVFLVRCLSRYILASLAQPEQHPENALWSILACLGCTLLVVSQGDSAFVTHEELIFFWFTVCYISSYSALFVCTRLINRLQHGVLQLVASRLYASAETPYNPPILFLLAVRAFVKSRRPELSFLRTLTLLLDACMLSLMCVLGFGPAPEYLVALFVGASAWADLLG